MASTTFNTLQPHNITLHSRALGASVRPTAYHPKWNSDIQHLARDVQSFVGGPAFQHLLRSSLADEGYTDATQSHNFFDDKRITVHLTAGSIDVEVEGLPDRTHALALCLMDHGGLNLDDHIEAIDKQVTMRTQAAYKGHAYPQYTRLMQEHDTQYRRPHLIPLMKDIHRIFGPADELATSFGFHQTPLAQGGLSGYDTGSEASGRTSPLPEADSTSLLKTIADMREELEAERTEKQTAKAKLNEALESLHSQQGTIIDLQEALAATQSELKEAQANRDQALASVRNLKDQLSSTNFRAAQAEGRATHAEADATALRAQAASLTVNYHTALELLSDAKQALEEARAENRALTQEVTSLRDAAKTSSHALAEKGAALDTLTQSNENLQAHINRLDDQVDGLTLQLSEAKRSSKGTFKSHQAQLLDLEGQLASVQVERDEVRHQLSSAKNTHSGMAAEFEELKSAYTAQAQALANKEKALSATQSELEEAQASLASALQDKDALKAEVSDLRNQLALSAASVSTLKSALDEETAAKALALAALDEANSSISFLEDQNSSLDSALQDAAAKLDQAQALHDEALLENQGHEQALAQTASALSEATTNLELITQQLSASAAALEEAKGEKTIALQKATEAQTFIAGLQEALEIEGTNYEELLAALKKLLIEAKQEAREAQDNYAASEALANQRGQQITHLEGEIANLKRALEAKQEHVILVQETAGHQVESHLSQSTELKEKIALLENQLADAKKALQDEKVKSARFESNLEEALGTIDTLTTGKSILERSLVSASQKLAELQETHNAEFTALQDDMSQELQAASQKAKKQDALLSMLDQEAVSLRDELAKLKATPSQSDEETLAQIHTLQKALGRSEEQRASAEKDRREAIAEHEALSAKSIELFKSYEAQKAALAEKEEQIIALTERSEAYKSAAQESAEKLQEALAEKQSFIQETRERMQELHSNLKAAQHNYEQVLYEKELLENSHKILNSEKSKALQELEEARALIQELQHQEPLVVISPEKSETISKLERTIADSEAHSAELLDKINQLEEKEIEFSTILASASRTIEEQSELIAFKNEQISALESQLEKADKDAKISTETHELALGQIESDFNSEMMEMGKRLGSVRQDMGRLAEQNSALEADLAQAHKAGFELMKELHELQETSGAQESALHKRIELGDTNLKSEILKLKTALAESDLKIAKQEVLLSQKACSLDFAEKRTALLKKSNSALSEMLNKYSSSAKDKPTLAAVS